MLVWAFDWTQRGLWLALIVLCIVALPVIHVSLQYPISQKQTNRAQRRKQLVDPSYIVIDEVIGLLLCALIVLMFFSLNIWNIALSFGLFRLFDIFKPWPIKNIERSLEERSASDFFQNPPNNAFEEEARSTEAERTQTYVSIRASDRRAQTLISRVFGINILLAVSIVLDDVLAGAFAGVTSVVLLKCVQSYI
jgi:phosphatidylglycerophosphatase A